MNKQFSELEERLEELTKKVNTKPNPYMQKGNHLGFKKEDEEDKPKKPLLRPSPSGRVGNLN